MRSFRSIWQRVAPCVLPVVQAHNALVPAPPVDAFGAKFAPEYDTLKAVREELPSLRPELAFVKQPELNQNDALLLPEDIDLRDLQTGTKQNQAVCYPAELKACTAWGHSSSATRGVSVTAPRGFSHYMPEAALVVDFSKLPNRQCLPAYITCQITGFLKLFDDKSADRVLTFYDVPHGQHSRLPAAARCSSAREVTRRLLDFYDQQRFTWWQTIQMSPTHQIELSLALRLQDGTAPHGVILRGGPDRSKVDVKVHISQPATAEAPQTTSSPDDAGWQLKPMSAHKERSLRTYLNIPLHSRTGYPLLSVDAFGGVIRYELLGNLRLDADVLELFKHLAWGIDAEVAHMLGAHLGNGTSFMLPVDLDGECARLDNFWLRFTQDLRADSEEVRKFFAGVGERGKAWNSKVKDLLSQGVPESDLHKHYTQPALKERLDLEAHLAGDTADSVAAQPSDKATNRNFMCGRAKRVLTGYADAWVKKWGPDVPIRWGRMTGEEYPLTFPIKQCYLPHWKALKASYWDMRQPIYPAVERLQLDPTSLKEVYLRQRWMLAKLLQPGVKVTFEHRAFGTLGEDGLVYDKQGKAYASPLSIAKAAVPLAEKKACYHLRIAGRKATEWKSLYDALPEARKQLPPLKPDAQFVVDRAAEAARQETPEAAPMPKQSRGKNGAKKTAKAPGHAVAGQVAGGAAPPQQQQQAAARIKAAPAAPHEPGQAVKAPSRAMGRVPLPLVNIVERPSKKMRTDQKGSINTFFPKADQSTAVAPDLRTLAGQALASARTGFRTTPTLAPPALTSRQDCVETRHHTTNATPPQKRSRKQSNPGRVINPNQPR
ncbi:hypothetical protein WJX73_007708 [Symbiochloris irregularis]|uniref:Uncharacterized protein n=1 Tax=Symbiochloris irregularis TaxID=706552 RepID=A0AAW1PHJ2_9CHLO